VSSNAAKARSKKEAKARMRAWLDRSEAEAPITLVADGVPRRGVALGVPYTEADLRKDGDVLFLLRDGLGGWAREGQEPARLPRGGWCPCLKYEDGEWKSCGQRMTKTFFNNRTGEKLTRDEAIAAGLLRGKEVT